MDIQQYGIEHREDGYYWYLVNEEGVHSGDPQGPFASRNDAEVDAKDTIAMLQDFDFMTPYERKDNS